MDPTTPASDTIAAPLATDAAPRPTTRQQHRAAQRKYHEEKRRGCGSRVRILPATFQALRKYGNSHRKACTDQRKSAATDGLVAILNHPQVRQWLGSSLLNATHPLTVRSSGKPKHRKQVDRMWESLETKIRLICISNKIPVNRAALRQIVEVCVGMRTVAQPSEEKKRELWVPLAALPLLEETAAKVQSRGAHGYVATLHRPSIGAIIDWIVGCPRIAAELSGSAAKPPDQDHPTISASSPAAVLLGS